jgi:hypothetical protein
MAIEILTDMSIVRAKLRIEQCERPSLFTSAMSTTAPAI